MPELETLYVGKGSFINAYVFAVVCILLRSLSKSRLS